jgi:hypothetical protein
MSSIDNFGQISQRSHFFGGKQQVEPSKSKRPSTFHSGAQVQDVDKRDIMITHLLNMIDKMQGDYSKLTEECLRANKELLAVKFKKAHGPPKNAIGSPKINTPGSKFLSQFSNKSPSKFISMADALPKKDLVEKSTLKKRIKILDQEVAMQSPKELESMIVYADSDQPARNFDTL